jgi:hypothetical protein
MRKLFLLLLAFPLLSYGQYGVPKKFSQIPVSTVPAVSASDYFVGTHNNGDGTFTDYLYQPSSSIVDTITSLILGVTYAALDSGLATRASDSLVNALNTEAQKQIDSNIVAIDSVAALATANTFNQVLKYGYTTNRTAEFGKAISSHPYSSLTLGMAADSSGSIIVKDSTNSLQTEIGMIGGDMGIAVLSGSNGASISTSHGITYTYAGYNTGMFNKFFELNSNSYSGANYIMESATTNYDTYDSLRDGINGYFLTTSDTPGNAAATNFVATPRNIPTYTHTVYTPVTTATVNVLANQTSIIAPSGTIAALTIHFPASPTNNTCVVITYAQTVSVITYTGGTVVNGASSSVAGQTNFFWYDSATSTWY